MVFMEILANFHSEPWSKTNSFVVYINSLSTLLSDKAPKCDRSILVTISNYYWPQIMSAINITSYQCYN